MKQQSALVRNRAIISVLIALVVHGVVFASWISVILLDVDFSNEIHQEERKPASESEVTVILTPIEPAEPLRKLMPKVVEQPKPQKQPPPALKPAPVQPPKPPVTENPATKKSLSEQKRRFARTSAEQAGTPDKPTNILGDRDTQAASELPADPNKAETPSQAGTNPLYPDHVETVDRQHIDGSVGMDKSGAITETPQEATARKDSDKIDQAPKVDISKSDQGSSAKAQHTHLKQGPELPSTDSGEGKRAIVDQQKTDHGPKEKPNQGSKKDGQGDETEQTPKKDGFQGLSKKTKITGSISRRGKSALNVKNSPLGRYQSLVSKAVELQWRRKCEDHRDHIVPGVVSVRFYVDANGEISGVKFQEVIGASYIMTGFTQRAIRKADLPKMPKSVIKELDGEPLELIYNFYF